MSALVCPKCGRKSDSVEFIEAFCINCYPVRITTPDRIELDQCVRCGRMRFRGDWTAYNERKVSEYIISKCRGDFQDASYNHQYQTASFLVKEGSARIEKMIPLDIRKTICPQCSRISGGYFEAIIQLRGDRKKMDRLADAFIERLGKKTFISKTEEKDGGIDIYIGNSKAVVAMMGDLGLKVLMTKKLVGRDQGKRLYRTTFLLRV
ncbi:MAG: NMD3-related protein [Candidatus Micrarchaeia archaeon]